MAEITFYRQVRKDGGIRTGIELGSDSVFSSFEPGLTDSDPALVWYVDVRCSGPTLPADREGARQWLLRHSTELGAVLGKAADQIPAGYDPVEWPLQVSGRVDGADVTVVTSAVRRTEARDLASILRELAGHLHDHLEALGAASAA